MLLRASLIHGDKPAQVCDFLLVERLVKQRWEGVDVDGEAHFTGARNHQILAVYGYGVARRTEDVDKILRYIRLADERRGRRNPSGSGAFFVVRHGDKSPTDPPLDQLFWGAA